MEPNVLNFFLIVLGGFGVVWAFKGITGRRKIKISDFEYLAFSPLWGIPIFMIFWFAKGGTPDSIKATLELPMSATPILFLLGLLCGSLAGYVFKKFMI